jgi:3-deoxy-7-phosphoheptulonate synthase
MGHPFIYQIGTHNAQNYELLKAVGKTGVPVLLKRGQGSSLKQTLGSARYVTEGGSPVILCERGIVTSSSGDPKTQIGRYTADHLAVLKFQEAGYLTIFDPSHAAGKSDHVIPLALSGLAIGANGLIVEAHHDPASALCDAEQALTFEQFGELMQKAKGIEAVLRGDYATST